MRKTRLIRLDKPYQEHPVFFVTLCTYQRKELLANQKIHESFRLFCAQAGGRNIEVGRYVVMPDHIHLFVRFDESSKLSIWIKSLKNALSKTLRFQGHASPHWQKDFFDHILRSEESYDAKWQYVEQNPVRAGLVASTDVWPYQSEITKLTME